MIGIDWVRRPQGLWRWDAAAAAGLGAWAIAWLWPRLPMLHPVLPACHFLAFTGLPCGTCGFTRAFTRGARLDVAGAFAASPLATLLFYGWIALSLCVAASWVAPALRLPRPRVHPQLARWGPVAVFLGNWAWLLSAGGIR